VLERGQRLPDLSVLGLDHLLELRHGDRQLLDLGRLVDKVLGPILYISFGCNLRKKREQSQLKVGILRNLAP
jgi:hypothetical protein